MTGKIKEVSNVERIMIGAKNEINEEITKKYREKVKSVMRELKQAQMVVRNLEDKLEDIEIRIAKELE